MLRKEASTAKRSQLTFIEPMYAQAVRDLPAGGEWSYEAKLDGYRCIAAKQGNTVVLWSRRGNVFTARFPEIAHAFEPLPPDTIVDGEVVAVDESGRISFNALQHHRSNAQIQFYAFDVLVHRGRSVLHTPLEKRQALLEEALAKVQ